jgi:hypothetical protein
LWTLDCPSISSDDHRGLVFAGSQYKWGQSEKQGESRKQGESGKKGKVEKKTPAKMTTIKVERDGVPIHRCDMKVKVEENNKVKVESLFPGAKANLADLTTWTEELKLVKQQMSKRLFNSEVNLVSDWLLEHL